MVSEHTERLEAHPQTPTYKWAKFQKDLEDHALRAAGVREQRDRERTDATVYHRDQEKPPTTGGPSDGQGH